MGRTDHQVARRQQDWPRDAKTVPVGAARRLLLKVLVIAAMAQQCPVRSRRAGRVARSVHGPSALRCTTAVDWTGACLLACLCTCRLHSVVVSTHYWYRICVAPFPMCTFYL